MLGCWFAFQEQFGEDVRAELVHGAGVSGPLAGLGGTAERGEHGLALLRSDDGAEAGHAVGQGLEHHPAFVLRLAVANRDEVREP